MDQRVKRRMAGAWLRTVVVVVMCVVFWGTPWEALAARQGLPQTVPASAEVVEVSPPVVIQELRPLLDQFQPQVAIESPEPNVVVADDTVPVMFRVEDLPVFRDSQVKLGPHLQVFLDREPYAEIFDVSQPLQLEGLQPGTHVLHAIAAGPWNESFKNPEACAQLVFHSFTKTSTPVLSERRQLLYGSPVGGLGAEPLLLDFFSCGGAQQRDGQSLPEPVKVTVNGQSFVTKRWQALFLQGFKVGKNWLQLDVLDDQGEAVPQAIRLVTMASDGQDALSQLMRGELSTRLVRRAIDPDYAAMLDARSRSVDGELERGASEQSNEKEESLGRSKDVAKPTAS